MLTLDIATLRYPLIYPHISAYPNLGATKPYEDSCKVAFRKPAFVVTDGVTRSAEIGEGNLLMALGAFHAAEAFAQGAINSLQMPVPVDAASLRGAFAAGNQCVEKMNQAYGLTAETTDWFEKDLLGCCAALGIIDESGTLWYGWIGDCSIAVFDKNDMPRLITPEEVSILEQYREGLGLDRTRKMIFWREVLRNHPEKPHLSYGVATGEKEAEPFFHQGSIALYEGDLALFYSDGAKPITIGNKKFRDTLRVPMPSWQTIPLHPEEHHSDATIIVIQVISL